jgi:predicted nuclease of predicted toxin-antitoxin system
LLPGAPDEAVINLALRESRILLTEDKDFGQLVFSSSAKSPGVVLVRFPASARQAMAKTVVEFVQQHPDKVAGRFVVVQPGRIRISKPIGNR